MTVYVWPDWRTEPVVGKSTFGSQMSRATLVGAALTSDEAARARAARAVVNFMVTVKDRCREKDLVEGGTKVNVDPTELDMCWACTVLYAREAACRSA